MTHSGGTLCPAFTSDAQTLREISASSVATRPGEAQSPRSQVSRERKPLPQHHPEGGMGHKLASEDRSFGGQTPGHCGAAVTRGSGRGNRKLTRYLHGWNVWCLGTATVRDHSGPLPSSGEKQTPSVLKARALRARDESVTASWSALLGPTHGAGGGPRPGSGEPEPPRWAFASFSFWKILVAHALYLPIREKPPLFTPRGLVFPFSGSLRGHSQVSSCPRRGRKQRKIRIYRQNLRQGPSLAGLLP